MNTLCVRHLKIKESAFDIFKRISRERHAFFLDSSMQGVGARFSYLGFDPIQIVKGCDLSALKKVWQQYRVNKSSLIFPAGAVGYLAYDGSLWFGLYDGIIAFDHQQNQLIISALTKKRLNIIEERLRANINPLPARYSKATVDFKSNFTKARYTAAVRRALAHIKAGDIYQINLSHRLQAKVKGWQSQLHAADIYGALRQESPSSLGAYLDCGAQHILSASPERFLQLRNRTVEVCPMKGTRPRGQNKREDARLKKDLLNSPKEVAELLMVTDLERNDLGRVCAYGTVKVKCMRSIEEYATVFQATSTVQGQLHQQFDQFDLLKATFPSGSVTGCPKIAAMQLIEKLEGKSRGLYTGALGYISFTGAMDFNVMIRTLFLKKDLIACHVGGGIVADSKPDAEWEETWVKAKALMGAVSMSLQGDK